MVLDDPSRSLERQFLQSVIEAFPFGAMVIDRQHRVLLANRMSREISGRRDPVAAGLRCHEVSHFSARPCSGDDDPCPLQQVLRTRAPVTVVHTHYDVAGRASLVEVRAAPILDADGNVEMVIEAQRELEKEIDEGTDPETRHRQQAIIDASPHGIVTLDPEASITSANRTACQLLGRGEPDLLGRPFADLVVASDHQALTATLALARCHPRRHFRLPALTLIGQDGGTIPIQALFASPPSGQGLKEIVGFLHDGRT